MDYELRITVEKVAISTQEVVKRDTIKICDIKAPESILDSGLRHAEQISLLEKVQNSLIAEQSVLIEADPKFCPKCVVKRSKRMAPILPASIASLVITNFELVSTIAPILKAVGRHGSITITLRSNERKISKPLVILEKRE